MMKKLTSVLVLFLVIGVSHATEVKLTARDGAADNLFGYSVSISEGTAIVEALFDDDNGPESGSAYVFLREGTTWTEQQKLTVRSGAISDLLVFLNK